MISVTQYRQALIDADVRTIEEIESNFNIRDLQTLSTPIQSTLLRRLGQRELDQQTHRSIVEAAFEYGHRDIAINQAFRSTARSVPSSYENPRLRSLLESQLRSESSPLRKVHAIHLQWADRYDEVVKKLLTENMELHSVTLPQSENELDENILTGLTHELQTLNGAVLIVIANGQSEIMAAKISRLSNLPLIVLHFDLRFSQKVRDHLRPFYPTETARTFPNAVWVRYTNHKLKNLTVWDIESGEEIVLLNFDTFPSLLTFLIVRQLMLQDLQFSSSLGIEELDEQPNSITTWHQNSLANLKQFGLETKTILASILDHYWQIQDPSDLERKILARITFWLASQTESDRSAALDSAYRNEIASYIDEICIRELFVENRYSDVLRYSEATSAPLTDESSRLAAESEASLKLHELLDEPRGEQELKDNEDEVIVCILHASVPHQSGGYAIRAHGILTTLRKAGTKVIAVTRPGFPEISDTQESVNIVDGIHYHRLPPLRSYNRGEAQYMLESIKFYRDFLIKVNATKVHARSTYLVSIPAIIAAHQLGLKVVYEVSGLWELTFAGLEKKDAIRKRSTFGEYWETQAAHASDQILTMNDPMRDLMISRGANPEKIKLAPNAVDVNKFSPHAPQSDKKVRIGYIGSLVAYENVPLIVNAAKILTDEGLDFDVKIIGDGAQRFRITAAIKATQLEDIVTADGAIPHTQVVEEYKNMDIMVYPRQLTPATSAVTPLKPFEALAMAKAVVVSDIPPLREIAGHGSRGVIIKGTKPADLANALRPLISDASLRETLGKAGREWVEHERSWDTVVTAFQKAYEKL